MVKEPLLVKKSWRILTQNMIPVAVIKVLRFR